MLWVRHIPYFSNVCIAMRMCSLCFLLWSVYSETHSGMPQGSLLPAVLILQQHAANQWLKQQRKISGSKAAAKYIFAKGLNTDIMADYLLMNSEAIYSTINMMTSSNGNIFRVTGPLCGEFTGPRWIPHTKASDAELWCFLWSASA